MPTKLPDDQQAFWDDVLECIRWVLTLPGNPDEVQTYFSMWGEDFESKKNLELARRKLVPLKRGRKVKMKHVDKLRPSNVPDLLTYWEDTYAGYREHLDDEHPLFEHIERITSLVNRWRVLKRHWAAR